MCNVKETGDYTNKLWSLTEGILFHKQTLLEQICHSSIRWKVNRTYGTGQNLSVLLNVLSEGEKNSDYRLCIQEIHHIKISNDIVVSSGVAIREYDGQGCGCSKDIYEILATFLNGKVAFINITEIHHRYSGTVYRICSSNKEVYVMDEKEVLYIEACHNQVIWHCVDVRITANGSLRDIERQMSKSFVRIQRGYLVNKNQVRHIRRCEVEMNNGDILSIPSKKYVMMREKLFHGNDRFQNG